VRIIRKLSHLPVYPMRCVICLKKRAAPALGAVRPWGRRGPVGCGRGCGNKIMPSRTVVPVPYGAELGELTGTGVDVQLLYRRREPRNRYTLFRKNAAFYKSFTNQGE